MLILKKSLLKYIFHFKNLVTRIIRKGAMYILKVRYGARGLRFGQLYIIMEKRNVKVNTSTNFVMQMAFLRGRGIAFHTFNFSTGYPFVDSFGLKNSVSMLAGTCMRVHSSLRL